MNIADFIQLGLLIVAIVSIYISQQKDTKQRKLQMFAEYTRRYQDIFLQIPDDMFDNKTGKLNLRIKKYMRLYFDLCSEEYHLWQEGEIPDKVWNIWVEGMQIACNNKTSRNAWNLLKGEYNREFWRYFQNNVIDKKTTDYANQDEK
ncbi:MAG: hypothetical protein IJ199_01665 [Prevotella sp.]|nr:hypothetical protein [Prevotella sp.]